MADFFSLDLAFGKTENGEVSNKNKRERVRFAVVIKARDQREAVFKEEILTVHTENFLMIMQQLAWILKAILLKILS